MAEAGDKFWREDPAGQLTVLMLGPMDESDDSGSAAAATPQAVKVAAAAEPNSPLSIAKAGLDKRRKDFGAFSP